MAHRKNSQAELDGFIRQFKLFIGVAIVVFVVPLVIYALFLNRRLDDFESSLRYRPPEQSAADAPHGPVEHEPFEPVGGQVVYVPAYSHIYHEDGRPYLLTITLSIRNTSVDGEIVVKSVRYFDTHGAEIKTYLQNPLRLGPLASTEFLIERDDATGGSGANFLVEWVAAKPVTEPIVEAVMIDTSGQQGISFVTRGTPISDAPSE